MVKLGIYDVSIKKLEGCEIDLSEHKGKTLLLVNVASNCGFTPQYKKLQALYQKYGSKGLCVLAFPCNDFANQESGSEDQILEFCDTNYGVIFDIFEKIKIRGNRPHLFYKYLELLFSPVIRPKGLKPIIFQCVTSFLFWWKEGRLPQAGQVQWNFHKFLINRKGIIAGHFSSDYDPFAPQIIECIEHELEK